MRRMIGNNLVSKGMVLALSALFLFACGGGGGSVAGGGIGGSGVIASGSVTAKGSVHVNGSIYNTDSATFTLDDSPGAEDDIRRGMVVRVDGTRDTVTTGTATSVIYEDVVEGPLTSFSAPGAIMTLTVLGQNVIVEEGFTYVDDGSVPAPNPLPQTLPDFSAVTELEVSGLRDASSLNGVIRATYIEIKTGLTEYEVKGVVENANPPGSPTSFEIAGLTITTDGSTVGSIPADGTPVEVKGLVGDFSTGPDTLVADRIETRTAGLGETEFDHAEIEGFVTNLDTLNETFSLNGQEIDYSGSTLEGGAAGDLKDGAKVEAEGSITGGILSADKIEFKENIKIRANVDGTGSSITLEGLTGVVIVDDPSITEYDSMTSLSGLNQYDHIEIRGREIPDSNPSTRTILATEARLREPAPAIATDRKTEVGMQGLVDSFSSPSPEEVVILDVQIDTTSIPDASFTQLEGSYLGRTGFYNYLTTNPNTLVDMNGTLDVTDSSLDWTSAEIEND